MDEGGNSDRMFSHTKPNRRAAAVLAAVAISISLVACSSDSTTSEEPAVTTVPDPAPGAADGVTDLSEDGGNLDDGNFEGTERDTEVDQAEESG